MSLEIVIITGKKHSGKTAYLAKEIRRMKKQGKKLSGFISIAVRKGRTTAGYDIVDIKDNSITPFLRKKRKSCSPAQKTGRFFFLPGGLKKVSEIFRHRIPSTHIIVADELGPAEINHKKGVWKHVEKQFKAKEGKFYVAVREELVHPFMILLVKTVKDMPSLEIVRCGQRGAFL